MRSPWLIVALASCSEPLDQRVAIVDRPRVLAIASEPAEAHPGDPASYRALVAGPDGPIADPLRWAFCLAPKPPTEDNVVPDGCIRGDERSELGIATAIDGALPADGCLRFGPDTPPGGFRPRTADGTGGYYQPIRADLADVVAIGLTRITCKLPTAPPAVARDYELRYQANHNPQLVLPSDLENHPVPRGADVEVTAGWSADARESYLYFDPSSQQLVERREALRVSWFATAGTLARDASASDEDDQATSVATTWRTPAEPGLVWLWVVLRDSRGGIAFGELAVTVQ